ncbi:MAG: homoserine kinase [Frankiaceae bacterium]
MSVTARVPATSANLGPGFDALALALGLYDEVDVTLAAGGLHVDITGEGSQTLPRGEEHLVVRALRATFDRLGGQPGGLAIRCRNAIPQGRGLGSSAAAIVAGVVAARALSGPTGAERLDEAATLHLCADLEGHPDNVAGCLLGGLTVVWAEPGGARSVRLPVAVDAAIALVPPFESSTAEVRGLLPPSVPHADAAANAGRAALLTEALGRRPDLLLPATADWLHQSYRAAAMPASAALVTGLRAAGIAALVSGAGPTVLALGPGVESVVAPTGWRLLRLPVDRTGATVTEWE